MPAKIALPVLAPSIYKPAQSVNRQRVKKPNLSILAFSHKGQNLAVAAGSIGRQIRQAQLVKTNPTPSDFWYTHRQAIWLRHVDPGGASRVKRAIDRLARISRTALKFGVLWHQNLPVRRLVVNAPDLTVDTDSIQSTDDAGPFG